MTPQEHLANIVHRQFVNPGDSLAQSHNDSIKAVEDALARVAGLEAINAGLLQANRDCSAWYEAQQHDLERCLKALGDIAGYANLPDPIGMAGDAYRIANETINSFID